MLSVRSVSPPQLVNRLSPSRCHVYEQLAMATVDRTVADYIRHICVSIHPICRVDTSTWKLVKKRDDIQIYKSRGKVHPTPLVDTSTETPWTPSSRLLCVGTLAGTLDDAMLGTATPTEMAMATRSLCTKDEFIQHHVLQDFKVPTEADPFEYVGLKWSLRSSSLQALVRPRDLVYVDASGYKSITLRGKRERVGYVVCHSVEVPELEPFTGAKHIVRGKFSMCAIYRQRAFGVVDVYVTVLTCPGGNIPPKLAALSASVALLAYAKAMDCALDRKLMSRLNTNFSTAVAPDGSCIAVAKAHGSQWCCLQCTRALSSFASLVTCDVCHVAVCPRCLISRKLVVGATPHELELKPFQICAGCIESTHHSVDTKQIAAEAVAQFCREHGPRQTGGVGATNHTSRYKTVETLSVPQRANGRTLSDPIMLYTEGLPKHNARTFSEPIVLYNASDVSHVPHAADTPTTAPLVRDHLATETEDEEGSEGIEDEFIEDLTPVPVSGLALLEQMNELWLQAEQTLRMTKIQTRSLQQSMLEFDECDTRRPFSKSVIYTL